MPLTSPTETNRGTRREKRDLAKEFDVRFILLQPNQTDSTGAAGQVTHGAVRY